MKLVLALAALLSACVSSYAVTCDVLKSEIESKIRAGGMTNFTLGVVDADSAGTAKVVGSCELGTKKIVYSTSRSTDAPATGSAADPKRRSADRRQAEEEMWTECKDGFSGPDCKRN
jgi:hypothetical protein